MFITSSEAIYENGGSDGGEPSSRKYNIRREHHSFAPSSSFSTHIERVGSKF
jgi:hypothetical protein